MGEIREANYPDVRTLLLCRIHSHAVRDGSSYNTLYKQVYPDPQNHEEKWIGKRFITYGHFDAMSIYPIQADSKWLYNIYRDNETISKLSFDEISYLPIHLVSYKKDDKKVFWNEVEHGYPFCLATLCYGVNTMSTVENETCIQDSLEKYDLNHEKVKFAVYRATSICDVVVLWYTNDINYVLNQISKLNQEKNALKTYSIVGFPMDNNGSPLYVSAIQDKEMFHMRITGSIRKHQDAFPLLLAENSGLQESMGVHPHLERTVFGKEDFCLLLPNLSGASLKRMLDWFSMDDNSKKISEACWEIHTEFLLDPMDTDLGEPKEQNNIHIMKPLHDSFARICKKDCCDYNKYPWVLPFLELLGVHSYIDRNPILRSPSYLFFDFLDIVRYYFENQSESYIDTVLSKSLEKIQNVIRHWNNITDKVTRVEELIFKGLGSSTIIFNTIPFCVLDFYQSFLRQIINMLIDIDEQDGRKPNDYEYAFLLLPEYNQRPRISSIFHHPVIDECQRTDSEKCGDICRKKCKRRWLSPLKQVYLVEFPIELLYKPMDFMFPMMHECAHIFGDTLRLRNKRRGYMTQIIANELLKKLHLYPQRAFNDFYLFVCYKLRIHKDEELLSIQLRDELLENLKKLLRSNIDDVEKEMHGYFLSLDPRVTVLDTYYLKTTEVSVEWRNNQAISSREFSKFWEVKIAHWEKYFKECYADLIAILLLETSVSEYLRLFEKEANTFNQNREYCFAGTRIGLVLAALICKKDDFISSDEVISTIAESNLTKPIKWYVKNTITSFVNDTHTPSKDELSQFDRTYAEDISNLFHVRAYLAKVVEEFCAQTSKLNSVANIRKKYKDLIVDGKMFNDEFYEIIDDCHSRINDNAKKLRENNNQNK